MYSWLDASRKQIRLLHVHPGVWNDDVRGHLQTVSLNDKPKFYAISYVWGDPAITLPIIIDGEPLEITQNLCDGLRRLRKADEALIIFADAACINQLDLSERSQQVQLMGEIYSFAEEVLIWLGYGNDKQALAGLPDIIDWTGDERDDEIVDAYFKRSKYQEAGIEHQNKAEDVLGLFVYLRIRAMDKHLADTPFFTVDNDRLCPQEGWQAVIRAMNTFSANPWWSRIWAVQETVLARRATVIYHNFTFPWKSLIKAVHSSKEHDFACCRSLRSSLPLDDNVTTDELLYAVYSGAAPLQDSKQRGEKLSLRQVMRRVNLLEATDIRDKVFGVLGLVTDWQGLHPIIPDYSLPPEEVFAQAIVRDIQGTRTLTALMGTTMSGIPGLPSWVIEVSPKTTARYIAALSRISRSALYSSAGWTTSHAERRGAILIIDALEPAQAISELGPRLYEADSKPQDIVHAIATCYRMIETAKERDREDSTTLTSEEALWRTLTGDSWRTLQLNEADPSKHTPEISKRQRFGNTNVARLGKNLQNWYQTRATSPVAPSTLYGGDLSDDRFFYEAWFESSFHRNFFITTDGHMGVGPLEMLPGDSVAILLGGNIPFCLREVPEAPKGHYTLVGDTYVHGLMDGEGVPVSWKEHVVKIHLH